MKKIEMRVTLILEMEVDESKSLEEIHHKGNIIARFNKNRIKELFPELTEIQIDVMEKR